MPRTSKKFIFLVQGEGRGHMTQAIGLYQILTGAGHQVIHVFTGKSERRKIPGYFTDSFNCPVEPLNSPNFVADPENKSIRLLPSILYNIRFLGKYKKSLNRINDIVKSAKPDGIINFYDFLGGFYNLFYRPGIKFFAIGHQFLTDHPDFIFAKGHFLDRKLFLFNNTLNSLGANKKLALSFLPYHPEKINKTIVVPPVLRKELFELIPDKENFILGYMVNDGYSQEIINWHNKNRQVRIHCFWDKKGEPEVKEIHPNLTFHQLNAQKFMHMMARCSGLITTAGFESICEAMYLGKPVMMVPVAGQYEQACNALDAARAGAGIWEDHFRIGRFLDYLRVYKDISTEFNSWLNKSTEILVGELTDF